MNERIRELANQAGAEVKIIHGDMLYISKADLDLAKFAELIIRECIKESMEEIVDDEDMAQETDPLIREYLLGNNQGIVDAVIKFRNHFGVE